ncbi:MAG: nucleotide sugar dehydrogenase, partial [Planctomycetes bacterium]|nr:nucleotide sugar dehydrogenase [Planctomycetota bacterium]
MTHAERLSKKIENRTAIVGIMGLGYVGLPLVREFCGAGFEVIGFDVDERKVSMLKRGKTYIRHLPAQMFKDLIKKGRFTPTSDMKLLKKPDAILICV